MTPSLSTIAILTLSPASDLGGLQENKEHKLSPRLRLTEKIMGKKYVNKNGIPLAAQKELPRLSRSKNGQEEGRLSFLT